MTKLWVHFLDIQYSSDNIFRCYRGEITSASSAKRRLEQRSSEDARKLIGKRSDLLVVEGGNIEHKNCYGEASKLPNESAAKNVFDSQLKTNKTMKDMLTCFTESVERDPRYVPLLRTSGYQCSRSTLKLMVMDQITKYIMRIRSPPSVTLDFNKDKFIGSVCDFYKLANKDLLVCHDTLNTVKNYSSNQSNSNNDLDDPLTLDDNNYLLSGLKTPPSPENRKKKQRTLSTSS